MSKAFLKKNANIIGVAKDFATLSSVTSDGYFVYKIKYLVDPIKAIRNKTFLTEIHVSEEPFVRASIKTFQNFNTSAIVRSLRLRRAFQKDALRAKKENYILTYRSDITKSIPNDQTILLSKARFTDKLFAKTILRIKPALINDLRKQNLQLPILDKNINKLDESDIEYSARKIKLAASNLITTHRRDPANLVGSKTFTFLSADRGITGVIPKRPKSEQTFLQSSRLLVGTILNRRKLANQLQLPGDSYSNILVREQTPYVEVEETIQIPVGSMEHDEFYLIFQLKGQSNTTQQTITKRVPHRRNIAILEMPVLAPEVKTLGVGQLGKNVLDIKQLDKNASAVRIFRRQLNMGQANLDAEYTFIGEVLIEPDGGRRRITDIFASINPVIYRVIPVNSSGIMGAEFTSVVVQQERGKVSKRSNFLLRPHFISISHSFQKNSVVITLRDFPPGPIALKLLRKDLTIKEQKNQQVGNAILLDVDTNMPIILEDTDVKNNRIYQYTINYIYKDGSVVTASNKLILEYSPVVSNIVQLDISEPEVIGTGGELDAKFTIKKDIIETQGELIKSFLQEQGLLSEFQEEIIKNRDTLQDLFAVRLTRTNLSTGELEDFGVIPSAEFSDKKFGKIRSVKPLEAGYDYQYNITAHARDIETLFPTLEKTVIPRPNIVFSLIPSKTRHPITLLNGTLTTKASLKKNYSKTTFTFGKVVDTQIINISLSDVLPGLYEGKANKFGENSILVQWKVQGNVNKIDHFLIVLEVLGIKTIVGKSHNTTNTNSFQFVDILSNKECGALQYFIIPILFDYGRGTELKTNQVIK